MRHCGDCQLCCKVMPILEIGKKAGARCDHQKHGKGCMVHGTAAQPMSCKKWSCWWLMNPTFMLPRPDRAGYVVDPQPDFVVFGEDVHKGKRVPALQIWADPARPDAWRKATAWIKQAVAEKQAVAIIRFDERLAVVLVPPSLSDNGEWREIDTRPMSHVEADSIRLKTMTEALEKATAGEAT